MAYSNLYVKILIFLLANLVTQQNVHCNEYDEWGIYPQSKHSLKKPYSYEWESTTIINNVNWELVGNALAHRSFIRLTEDRANQAGGVWNTLVNTLYLMSINVLTFLFSLLNFTIGKFRLTLTYQEVEKCTVTEWHFGTFTSHFTKVRFELYTLCLAK